MWIDYFHIPPRLASEAAINTTTKNAYLIVKDRLTWGETITPKGSALEGGVLTVLPGIVNFLHALSANLRPERPDPGNKTRAYDPKR
jgi:hypothetical protein